MCPPAGPPAARPAAGPGRLLVAGAVILAGACGGYLANLLWHPRLHILSWLDLRVYAGAGYLAFHQPASLYTWQLAPGIRFTYPPFAALVFADLGRIPWPVLTWLFTAASVIALGVASWLTFGALGWAGRARLGATLALTGAALWTEPVQRALHLGQVDLLLMALAVADLCQPAGRRWQGAGIGLAAGIKLTPLIFIPYLLLTRRYRAAAVAGAAFGAVAAVGFAALPQASVQWWFGPDFVHASRTGFIGFIANQSLLGLLTRVAGGVAAATGWYLAAAVVVGVAGLLTAAALHRAGWPVHGWLTCALTGLLVSPVSWDHHWVWVVPALAALVDAGRRAHGRAGWAPAVMGIALFGAWPARWPLSPVVPWGVIWAAPGTLDGVSGHPWDREYHWHGAIWVAGNLYVLTGLAVLAGLAAVAAQCAGISSPRSLEGQ